MRKVLRYARRMENARETTAPVNWCDDVGTEGSLSAREEQFAQEWARTGNKAAAFRIVYKPAPTAAPGTVWSSASRMAARPHVARRFNELQQQAALEVVVSIHEALQHQFDIATADPNDIAYVAKRACRNCHGIDHRYQWESDEEYFAACIKAIDEKAEPPSDAGGFGYDRAREPALDCPRCLGVGLTEVVVNDTTKLEGKARKLYKGVDFKNGEWVVVMHDQQKAWENVCRMLGAYNDKLDLRSPAERKAMNSLPEGIDEREAARAYVEFCR